MWQKRKVTHYQNEKNSLTKILLNGWNKQRTGPRVTFDIDVKVNFHISKVREFKLSML